jgi:hypothetical protein
MLSCVVFQTQPVLTKLTSTAPHLTACPFTFLLLVNVATLPKIQVLLNNPKSVEPVQILKTA